MAPKKRILIVDDHQLVILGILYSLTKIGNFDVVTTNTCDAALDLILKHKNDRPFEIVFTDLSFDNGTKATKLDGGEALIKALKNQNIDIKIGVITGHVETNRIYNVIQNLNPDAYLIKSKCGVAELRYAIEKMQTNDFYYSHEVHQKIMRRTIIQIQMDEVAIQILKELPNQPKISNLEGVILKNDGTLMRLRSIETKLSNLRADLGANNNTDLVLKAKELGVID
ncbi:MAG: response regulator [Polaribacter sp.]|nr:response regulator [Polaribacter sp.]MDB4171306.1 response regulator [Polaribacter sp.]MDG1321217.1 response regulator [Polaribacter sp.]